MPAGIASLFFVHVRPLSSSLSPVFSCKTEEARAGLQQFFPLCQDPMASSGQADRCMWRAHELQDQGRKSSLALEAPEPYGMSLSKKTGGGAVRCAASLCVLPAVAGGAVVAAPPTTSGLLGRARGRRPPRAKRIAALRVAACRDIAACGRWRGGAAAHPAKPGDSGDPLVMSEEQRRVRGTEQGPRYRGRAAASARGLSARPRSCGCSTPSDARHSHWTPVSDLSSLSPRRTLANGARRVGPAPCDFERAPHSRSPVCPTDPRRSTTRPDRA